jgi:hypothetical protein
MEFLGESLSENSKIEFLTGNSPAELQAQLKSIKLPFRIVTIYAMGGAHIAWIIPTLPIKKVSKTKNKGE